MRVSYDKNADAVYIEFSTAQFANNKKIDDSTVVDFDKNGNIIGIEILNASGSPLKALTKSKVLLTNNQ